MKIVADAMAVDIIPHTLERNTMQRLLLCLAMSVCCQAIAQSPASKPAPQPADKEFVTFARDIEKNVNSDDGSLLAKSFDRDFLFSKKNLPCLDMTDPNHRGFCEGFGISRLATSLAKAASQGASYRLLAVWKEGDTTRALFRLLLAEGGFNYHELKLVKGPKGILVNDMYIFAMGEWMSETIRRSWMPILTLDKSGKVDPNIGGPYADMAKNMDKFEKMQKLFKGNDAAGALDVYKAMPESVRKLKFVNIQAILIAAQVGEKEYTQAVDEFRKRSPNDPSLNLLLIDRYFTAKQYKELAEVIDQLDARVQDPALNLVRANTWLAQGKKAQARQCLETAIQKEKDLKPAYWALVELCLADKDYSRTAQLLTIIENDLKVPMTDLKEAAVYEGFVQSKEYKNWMKSRKRETATAPE